MHGFGVVVVIWRQKNIYLWADTGRERERIRGNGMPPAPSREGTLEENGQEGLCFLHQSTLPVPPQSSMVPTSFISLKSTSPPGPVQISFTRALCLFPRKAPWDQPHSFLLSQHLPLGQSRFHTKDVQTPNHLI